MEANTDKDLTKIFDMVQALVRSENLDLKNPMG
jgi:hypothetical protein